MSLTPLACSKVRHPMSHKLVVSCLCMLVLGFFNCVRDLWRLRVELATGELNRWLLWRLLTCIVGVESVLITQEIEDLDDHCGILESNT